METINHEGTAKHLIIHNLDSTNELLESVFIFLLSCFVSLLKDLLILINKITFYNLKIRGIRILVIDISKSYFCARAQIFLPESCPIFP